MGTSEDFGRRPEAAARDGVGQLLVGSVRYPTLLVDGLLSDRDWLSDGLDELIIIVRNPETAVERLGRALKGLRTAPTVTKESNDDQ